MKQELREAIRIIRKGDRRAIGMRHRVMLYLVSLLLAVVAGLIVLLSAAGFFSNSRETLQRSLSLRQHSSVEQIVDEFDRLTAQGISLSANASRILKDRFNLRSVDQLNNDPEGLKEIEMALFDELNIPLHSHSCSGAYIVLDCTINTETENAGTSRAGLYVRFANLSGRGQVNQDMTVFRGISDVSNHNRLELHNRWRMEFSSEEFPFYGEILSTPVDRLAEACVWTQSIALPGTWENVMLLAVPVLDSAGEVCGICGVELSEMFFRLSYPYYAGEFGSMITAIAPVKNGQLRLSQGLLGGSDGIKHLGSDVLTIEETDDMYTYTAPGGSFFGMQTKLPMKTIDGSEMYVVTLLPKETFVQAETRERLLLIAAAMGFFVAMLMFSLYLSKRFVQPIAKSLAALETENTDDGKGRSGIKEIDALVAYVGKKQQIDEGGLPADITEMFDAFAEKAKNLTPTERSIVKYYANGKEINEVAELAFISIHTVRKHNANIYQKLDIGSRDELMLYIELFRRCDRLNELC